MNLRAKLIEVGAEALDPFMVHPLETRDAATAVLDAFLNSLTENADEWAEATRMPTLVGGDALALIAVLRDSDV